MFSSVILERVSFVYYRRFNGNDGSGGAQVIEMDNEEVNRHTQDLDELISAILIEIIPCWSAKEEV